MLLGIFKNHFIIIKDQQIKGNIDTENVDLPNNSFKICEAKLIEICKAKYVYHDRAGNFITPLSKIGRKTREKIRVTNKRSIFKNKLYFTYCNKQYEIEI